MKVYILKIDNAINMTWNAWKMWKCYVFGKFQKSVACLNNT